jgi:hypothetical protein
MSSNDWLTLIKSEFDTLLDRLEDAEDALAILNFRERVKDRGWDAAIEDCLTIAVVEHDLSGLYHD